ncbi:MAG: methyltransferase domain-containing protein [Candidatus Hermodarchaeota archaeon]
MSKIGSKSWEGSSEEQEWRAKYLTQLGMLKIRRKFMEEKFSLLDFSSVESVLEIGCGLGIDGVLIAKYLKSGSRYLGVDIDPSLVEQANTMFKKANLDSIARAETADATTMPLTPNSEDIVMINRVLEHLSDPFLVVQRVFKVLKPGGHFLCIEPDWGTASFNHPDMELCVRMNNIPALYTLNWGTAGAKLREWFVKAGFSVEHMDSRSEIFLDFNLADMALGLHRTAEFAVKLGKATQEEATKWIDGLKQMSKEEYFFGTVTAIVFIGQKPLKT